MPRFKSTSTYYRIDDDQNPINIIGVITKIHKYSLGILVDWSNGFNNGYNTADLEVVDLINNNYSIY